ncbi:MAG: LacI family DNA-binding transcriptional regulator [Bacillota bacterium]
MGATVAGGAGRAHSPITIKDVALQAGTSTATVSRVLNGTGFVSPELRARVLAAARDLGYSPNAVARSLKQRSTHIIGVIISDIANPFFGSVVRGIEDVLAARQYHPLLCNTDRNADKEAMYVRLFCERRVDGVIISAAGQRADHLAILREQGIPWVFVNRRPPAFGGPAVLTDNRAGAYEATLHLIDLGHRRIGVVAGPQDVNTGIDRLAGYQEAMEARGLAIDPDWVVYGDFREESGYQGARKLMALPPERRITALFVTNNQMTIGVLRALRELGVRIPDDVALVGFDDSEWARIVDPPLTTVAQRIYEMGTAAARMLLRAVARTAVPALNEPGRDILLKPRLIVRASCGAGRLTVRERGA